MTQLSPALDAALAGDRVRIFGALRLTLPGGHVLRLLDGSAEIAIDGELYSGDDPAFGSWESIDEIDDGTGDEAPSMTIAMLPASAEAAVTMSSPTMQGAPVRVVVGAVSESTGLVIGDAYPVFVGEADVAVHRFGMRTDVIDLDCVGGMERLFFNDEGIRLNASWHLRVWPGELGFQHATGITDNSYWGMNAPTGPTRS